MTIKPEDILANRYQICRQLSKKSRGSTFLAQDLDSQALVIIKILRLDPEFQWDDLKLFEREALTLKNLDHPAIPKYLDYFELDEPDTRGFALVQTYVEAPSLETIIKSGRKFLEPAVIELANRLLSILTYLHEQIPPVIHRDIKPSNILLTNRSGHNIGDVYLIDFGSIQAAASKEEGTCTIVGTYGYMSPEQFGGQTMKASDLYSLGMTLIYLLTGAHPAQLPYVYGRVRFTSEISNQFRRWLEEMIQEHPDRRFHAARAAQTALIFIELNDGNFSHLKPDRSSIELYRDRYKLVITLPKHALLVTSAILIREKKKKNLSDYSSDIYQIAVLSVIGVVDILVCLIPALLYFLYYLISETISSLVDIFSSHSKQSTTTSNKLVIDRDTISLITEFVSTETIEQVRYQDYRSETDTLIYSPVCIVKTYTNKRNQIQKIYDKQVMINPELKIYCNSAKYSIGNGLSESELYWLGKELSDFLTLELQFICFAPAVSS